MLAHFVPPVTVTCILCKGSVSVRKGDKTRFTNHISHDHEVHFDMELIFALSFMSQVEKDTILGIMEPRFSATEGEDPSQNMETRIIQNNDEDVEIVDEGVLDEGSSTSVSINLTESGHVPVDNCDDSTACLICGKMILNKYLKIHNNRHKKENDSEKGIEEKDVKYISLDESTNAGIEETHDSNSSIIGEDDMANYETDSSTNEDSLKIDQISQKPGDFAKTDVDGKTVECKFCPKLMNKGSISRHIKRAHKNLVKSEGQLRKMDKQFKMEDKVVSKPKDSLRKCKICLKNIKSSGFNLHLKRTHAGRSEKCKLCYLRFKRKDQYKKHIENIHINDKHLLKSEIIRSDCTFNCELCSLKFITNNVLEYHIERVHGRGNEQCIHCERRYPDSKKLKNHIGRVHTKKTDTVLKL